MMNHSSQPRITISIVTYNSADDLRPCIQSLWDQEGTTLRVTIVDNGSTDETIARAHTLAAQSQEHGVRCDVIVSAGNRGYGGGHNIAIRQATTPYILLLNPDAILQNAKTLRRLVEVLEQDPQAAAVGPRLLLKDNPAALDSTGLQIYRSRRVIDRSKEEPDHGQYSNREIVFGLTGAAVLYRRSALVDAAEPRNGGGVEYFDEEFFMYKEDVDLAWRLNHLGWRHWYAPEARALHGRTTRGRAEDQGLERGLALRKSIDPRMLRYSFRNHRLMMIKNERWAHVIRDVSWILWREILFLGYIILREPSTLPALWGIIRGVPGALHKRRYVMKRVRVSWRTVARFFMPGRFLFWR